MDSEKNLQSLRALAAKFNPINPADFLSYINKAYSLRVALLGLPLACKKDIIKQWFEKDGQQQNLIRLLKRFKRHSVLELPLKTGPVYAASVC